MEDKEGLPKKKFIQVCTSFGAINGLSILADATVHTEINKSLLDFFFNISVNLLACVDLDDNLGLVITITLLTELIVTGFIPPIVIGQLQQFLPATEKK